MQLILKFGAKITIVVVLKKNICIFKKKKLLFYNIKINIKTTVQYN